MVKFLKDQMLQPKETAVCADDDEEEDDETNQFPIFIIVLVVRVLCGQSNKFGCANGADKTIPAGFNRVFPNCQILNILYKMFSPIMDKVEKPKGFWTPSHVGHRWGTFANSDRGKRERSD
jgi:hypothetical protein